MAKSWTLATSLIDDKHWEFIDKLRGVTKPLHVFCFIRIVENPVFNCVLSLKLGVSFSERVLLQLLLTLPCVMVTSNLNLYSLHLSVVIMSLRPTYAFQFTNFRGATPLS